VEGGEVELMVHQLAQGVFETAGLHLFVEVHWQELQTLVDRFEAGHSRPPSTQFRSRDYARVVQPDFQLL
jgi:hypothetical protein